MESSPAAPARATFFRKLWPSALLLICLAGVFDWLSAETRRLYLDEPGLPVRHSGTVRQHFALQGDRVIPQIIMRDDARAAFPLQTRVPWRLQLGVKPKGAASYEIYRTRKGARQLLVAEEVTKAEKRALAIPAGDGELEFASTGAVTWLDPRVVRTVFLWPLYAAAAVALMVVIFRRVRAGNTRVAEWSMLLLVVGGLLLIVEPLLRKYRLKLPPVIIAARTELGLAGQQDARWIEPERYKLRLRPNLNVYSEWRYGDITRLGYIPREVSTPRLHRYPVRTDAEGFRNAAVREEIEIAALGDSFTDGMTSPAEELWPARLEQLTGRAVQNFGTGGFGPQQAHYVFQDYVARRRPRWTVLAFYAGNDLQDAEAFDRWERGENPVREELTGWRLTPSFRRSETLYLWTLLRVATAPLASRRRGEGERPVEQPQFDRGMFRVPVAGQVLQFAFFPPNLQRAATPRAELEQSAGWQLTRATLAKLKAECEENGSRFVLMLIPSKEQVYWPVAEQALPPAALQEAVDFSARFNSAPLRVEEVREHRLTLPALVREFCAGEGIPFVDLTDPLQEQVATGREVFFADDTHWNATGHDIAARALAQFLGLTP
ncbi:hypothetical protein BH20VER2_BH20VER2_06320 [soil metagenome]